MGKKTTTNQTTTNAYDPSSMNAFQAIQNPLMQNILEGMSQDKLGALRLASLLKGADTSSQAEIQNLMRNMKYGGFGGAGMAPFMLSQLGRASRAASGRRANAQIQNLFLGEQLKQYYSQLGAGYKPLQTGSNTNTVTKESGLGTWLPSVAGIGIGLATGGLGFGAMGLGSIGSSLLKKNGTGIPGPDSFGPLMASTPAWAMPSSSVLNYAGRRLY